MRCVTLFFLWLAFETSTFRYQPVGFAYGYRGAFSVNVADTTLRRATQFGGLQEHSQAKREIQSEPLPLGVFACLGSRAWRLSAKATCISFSPDRRFALSGSEDSTIAFWDLKTGYRIRTFKGHSFSISSVAFLSNGESFVSSSRDGTMALWETATGCRVRTYEPCEKGDEILAMTLSPDNHLILWGTQNGMMGLTEVETGKLVGLLQKDSSTISCVAFSSDGRLALSGTRNKSQPSKTTLSLWDVATRIKQRDLEGHNWEVKSVFFTPDGRNAISKAIDHSIIIWDLKTGKLLRTTKLENRVAGSGGTLALSADGAHVLSCDDHGKLLLLDFDTFRILKTIDAGVGDIDVVALSPDGCLGLAGGDSAIAAYEFDKGIPFQTSDAHRNDVFVSLWIPNSMHAMTASADRTLAMWEIPKGERLQVFTGHEDRIRALAISNNGRYALSGSEDGFIFTWELTTARLLRKLNCQSRPLWGLALSPTDPLIVSITMDGLTLWNWETGERLRNFVDGKRISAACFSQDGGVVAAGTADGNVMLLDVDSGKRIRTMDSVNSGRITSIAMSPDNRFVASAVAAKSDNVIVWDTASGNAPRLFEGHSDWVSSVAFSPDGCWILTGGYDKALILWDLETGKKLHTYTGHLGYVHSVGFSPGSRFLISGSSDTTSLIWQSLRQEISEAKEWLLDLQTKDERQQDKILGLTVSDYFSNDFERVGRARERLLILGTKGIEALVRTKYPVRFALSAAKSKRLKELLEKLESDDPSIREKTQTLLSGEGRDILQWIEMHLEAKNSLSPDVSSGLQLARSRLMKLPFQISDIGTLRTVLLLIEMSSGADVLRKLQQYAEGPWGDYATELSRRVLEAKRASQPLKREK